MGYDKEVRIKALKEYLQKEKSNARKQSRMANREESKSVEGLLGSLPSYLYNCPLCCNTYTRKNRLKIHLLEKHLKVKTLFACQHPGCTTKVTEKGNLRVHMRLHKRLKNDDAHSESYILTCKFEGCGRQFNNQSNYKDHLRRHTSERPFICPYCP